MKETEKEFRALLFGVRRSIRYHNRRRQFFERLHKGTTFLSALAGTATFASVVAKLESPWTLSLAAAVTVFSVLDLVVGTAQAARTHGDLSRRFIALEKVMSITADPTESDVARFTSLRLDIEADEPPSLKVLDSICHNELLRAMGYDSSEFVKIASYQRLFCHICDIREHTIRRSTEGN